MIQNKHLTPFLANTLAMLAVVVPPLCSSYFYLQQPPDGFVQTISNITVIEQLGLYQNIPSAFTDAAAGFMKASCERPSTSTQFYSLIASPTIYSSVLSQSPTLHPIPSWRRLELGTNRE